MLYVIRAKKCILSTLGQPNPCKYRQNMAGNQGRWHMDWSEKLVVMDSFEIFENLKQIIYFPTDVPISMRCRM